MRSAALFILAAMAQPLEIHLAPDQPAPIFFTDEPLVVQFEASEPLTFSASISVILPNGEGSSWLAEQVELVAGRPMWRDVTSFPTARGPHVFHVRGDSTQTAEYRQTLVRLDRPREGSRGLVGVHVTEVSPSLLYALRCLPIAAVRIDGTTPDLVAVVRNVALNTPGRVIVRVSAGDATAHLALPEYARELSDVVDLWEITGADAAQEYAAVAGDIRRANPDARLAARVAGGRDAVALARADPALCPDVFVVSPDSVDTVEHAMQRAGIEGPSLLIEFEPPLDGGVPTPNLIPRLLEASLARHHAAIVPQRVLETAAGFSSSLSMFSSATRLFDGAELLTVLDGEGNNRAWLYGRLSDEQSPEWIAVVTYLDPNEARPEVPAGAAESWVLLDGHGNTRAESAAPETPLGELPGYGLWFIRGSGGGVLVDAHVRRLRARAAATLPYEEALAIVAPEAVTALRLLRTYSYPSPTRVQFINIVRSLPSIEEAWHRGILEPRDAVPLATLFADIARDLAAIREEMNETFLEPLERSYANCRELLGAYPDAEEGADARRVAFLRAEVSLLLDEARAREAAGRVTEAKGLAAIAEWRARSLEAAATIPLIQPEEAPMHDSAAEEPPTGEGEESETADQPEPGV